MMSAGCVLAILFLTLLILISAFVYRAKRLKIPSQFTYEDKPPLVRLYTKAFLVSLSRKQGVLTKTGFEQEDEETSAPLICKEGCGLTASNCGFDKERIGKYARVCGYGEDLMAAFPCYIETYFMPLLICIAASPKFRLSPLGLIHVRQTINTYSKLASLLEGPCSLECRTESYSKTNKGIEVNIIMKVFNFSQVCVWDGVATLLSRSPNKQRVGASQAHQQSSPTSSQKSENQENFVVEDSMGADLGVQYAHVAGDWNPHHLWPWTARFLGYNKPIAHGMCTLAKSLAFIHKQGIMHCDQPFKLQVEFKRPAFLPGTSFFSWQSPKKDGSLSLGVHDKLTKAPQLLGHITLP